MYDSVRLRYHVCLSEGERNLLADRLQACYTMIAPDGSITYQCMIRNLRVRIGKKGISVEGSLPKFVHGSNLRSLTLADTRGAVYEVCNILNLPIECVTITRLDAALNLQVSRPVVEFLPLFGECRYSNDFPKRLGFPQQYSGGLRYSNRIFSIVIYDKLLEMRTHREAIPNNYLGCHILRFEIQFKGRLGTQLGMKQLPATLLFDEEFYSLIAKWLHTAYSAIHKNHEAMLPPFSGVKTATDLVNSLASCGLEHMGQRQIVELIKMGRTSGDISKQNGSRMLAKVRDYSTFVSSQTHAHIIELDSKFEDFICSISE